MSKKLHLYIRGDLLWLSDWHINAINKPNNPLQLESWKFDNYVPYDMDTHHEGIFINSSSKEKKGIVKISKSTLAKPRATASY